MPALFAFRYYIMLGWVRVPVRSDVPLGGLLGGLLGSPFGGLFGSLFGGLFGGPFGSPLGGLLCSPFYFTINSCLLCFPSGITLCWVRLGFRSKAMFH